MLQGSAPRLTTNFDAFVAAAQIPRFAFEKFPGSQNTLSTQMKSVGEAMAIGRTFQVQRNYVWHMQLAETVQLYCVRLCA